MTFAEAKGIVAPKTRVSSRFEETKKIVEAVHARLGIPRVYTHREFVSEQSAMRESVRRKRAKQREEVARVEMFEAWSHGMKLEPEER